MTDSDLVAQMFPTQLVFWLGPDAPEDLDLVHEGKTLEEFLLEPDCDLKPEIGVVVLHEPTEFSVRIMSTDNELYDMPDTVVLPLSYSDLIELIDQ